jgi:hypothetical protein
MPSRGCDSLSSKVYHAIVILSEVKNLWDLSEFANKNQRWFAPLNMT